MFAHFCRVALVVQQDEETRTPWARVEKISGDPHAAFALMLASVATSRAHGGGGMLMPDAEPGVRAVPADPMERRW